MPSYLLRLFQSHLQEHHLVNTCKISLRRYWALKVLIGSLTILVAAWQIYEYCKKRRTEKRLEKKKESRVTEDNALTAHVQEDWDILFSSWLVVDSLVASGDPFSSRFLCPRPPYGAGFTSCKRIQDSLGFRIVLIMDSGFLELFSGFKSPGFRILQSKISRIPESRFPYMGRHVTWLVSWWGRWGVSSINTGCKLPLIERGLASTNNLTKRY